MSKFFPVATFFACAISAFFIYVTPSEEVVVSKSGSIYGTVEQIREKLQGPQRLSLHQAVSKLAQGQGLLASVYYRRRQHSFTKMR